VNTLWSYLWPAFAAGLVVGIIAGAIGFRTPREVLKDRIAATPLVLRQWRRKRLVALAAGAAISILAAALWHGPIGGADRFATKVERNAREALDYYEMTKVHAALHEGPLTRHLILSGPADDFQHGELVRLLSQLPGVSQAQWGTSPAGPPLMLEGVLVAVAGFLLGLLLAYLVELRRRYNAQWNW
jgi:hypothetical protein